MGERELPEGWVSVTLDDSAKKGEIAFQNGFACGVNNQEGRGIPQLRPMNVSQSGQIVLDSLKCIETDRDVSNYRLQRNDIIFNNTNSAELVGKTAVWRDELECAVLSNHMTIIRVINQSRFDPKFLARYLHSLWGKGYFENICQEHINQASVSLERLREVEIPLPPLPIQHQIVAVLEKAEAVKQQRQEADALMGALLQSVFLEMFGDTARNDREWDVVKIRDVTEKSQYGCSVLGTNEGQYPIIGMNNLTYEGKIDLKKLKYVNLSEKEFENFKLECGDVLFNRTNAPNLVGKTGLFQKGENFVFASYLIRLKLKMDIVDPQYLWTFLNSPYMKNKFSRMCKKAVNQANINAQELQNISIPLPPLVLQQQFALVVENVERIRDQQVASGRQIEGLCEGLMQRAFQGEQVA